MSRFNTIGRIAVLGLLGASALALTGCGKRGVLETPPPLFGDRARAHYEAQKEQQAQDAADARAKKGNSTAVADQPDDAPLTTRDIKAPEQKNIPASKAPIDGSPPDPFGAPPSTRPPG